MKAKSYVIGFISGFTLAGLGVLLNTPSSGKELRGKIKYSTDEALSMLQDVKESIIQLKNQAVSASSIGKAQISQFVDEMKDVVTEWQSESAVHTKNIQIQINDVETAIQELEAAISPLTAKSKNTAD